MDTSSPGDGGIGGAGLDPSPLRLAAVLGVGALVAVATPGIRMILPGLELSDAGTALVRFGGVTAVAGGVAGLLAGRRGSMAGSGGRPIPIVESLRSAAIIMAVVGLVALLVWPNLDGLGERSGPSRPVSEPGWGAGAEGGGVPPPPSVGGEQSIRGSEGLDPVTLQGESFTAEAESPAMRALRRAMRMLPFLMLAIIVTAFTVSIARRVAARWRGAGGEAAPLVEDDEAAPAAADATAPPLGADPRGRIMAAYLRMLAALEEADAGRAAHEAPHEHLHRVLAGLGDRAAPLHRLAEMYVVAQFTPRPLGEPHATAAAAHLEAGLTELRALGSARGEVPA